MLKKVVDIFELRFCLLLILEVFLIPKLPEIRFELSGLKIVIESNSYPKAPKFYENPVCKMV